MLTYEIFKISHLKLFQSRWFDARAVPGRNYGTQKVLETSQSMLQAKPPFWWIDLVEVEESMQNCRMWDFSIFNAYSWQIYSTIAI